MHDFILWHILANEPNLPLSISDFSKYPSNTIWFLASKMKFGLISEQIVWWKKVHGDSKLPTLTKESALGRSGLSATTNREKRLILPYLKTQTQKLKTFMSLSWILKTPQFKSIKINQRVILEWISRRYFLSFTRRSQLKKPKSPQKQAQLTCLTRQRQKLSQRSKTWETQQQKVQIYLLKMERLQIRLLFVQLPGIYGQIYVDS